MAAADHDTAALSTSSSILRADGLSQVSLSNISCHRSSSAATRASSGSVSGGSRCGLRMQHASTIWFQTACGSPSRSGDPCAPRRWVIRLAWLVGSGTSPGLEVSQSASTVRMFLIVVWISTISSPSTRSPSEMPLRMRSQKKESKASPENSVGKNSSGGASWPFSSVRRAASRTSVFGSTFNVMPSSWATGYSESNTKRTWPAARTRLVIVSASRVRLPRSPSTEKPPRSISRLVNRVRRSSDRPSSRRSCSTGSRPSLASQLASRSCGTDDDT